MRIIYHPEAEAELVEAAQFYDQRVVGLGSRFLAEFDSAVSDILQSPEQWPRVEGDLHRHRVRRFPFSVYYRVVADELRILVVRHHSRHPDYWRHRLGE